MIGKITLIGLGGAGINTAIKSHKTLTSLGDGYSECDIRLLDTTDKTIQAHHEYIDTFTKIVSKRASVVIDGAAGEKKDLALVKDIHENMKTFIDTAKLKNGKNNYYVIMSSASGGSGGNAAAILTSLMLERNYNVIVVSVGDTSSLLYLKNTIATLSSLQNISIKQKAALSIMYYNNTVNKNTTPTTEAEVDAKIGKMLTIMSVFVSGGITNIDHQDMNHFFRPSNYDTFTVDPGIYSLGVVKSVLNDEDTLLSRTIIKDGCDEPQINVDLYSNKTGLIPNVVSEDFDNEPIYLIFRKNILHAEVIALKKQLETLEHLNENKYNAFGDISDSIEDEDDIGLML